MIRPLREILDQYTESLIRLSASGGFNWGIDAFETELPGKWELSFAWVADDELIGYVVSSVKGVAAHIHQIVVDPRHRSEGIGASLLGAVRDAAATHRSITLKVHRDNADAIRFYLGRGFLLADPSVAEGPYRRLELELRDAKVCAVHQPNFLPHLGFFHKMMKSDVFVLLDDVQVPRGRSFAARNRILTPQGVQWLTLATTRPPGSEGKATYAETLVADPNWPQVIRKKVHDNYARAPHFDEVSSTIFGAMRGATLSEAGSNLIVAIARLLAIDSEILLMSELDTSGVKNEMIIGLCKAVGATHYLSGRGGGRSYADESLFDQNGLLVRFDDFVMRQYNQVWADGFVPNLSVIDVLFNIGIPETRKRLAERELGFDGTPPSGSPTLGSTAAS